jgi:hypothetical protein
MGGPCDDGQECMTGPLFGGPCAGRGGLWIRGEYMMLWAKGMNVPPLLTTSSSGTGSGILGDTDTRILFGDGNLEKGMQSGGRLAFGYWFGTWQQVGVEASYMGFAKHTERFTQSSQGTPVLARPFFDVDAGAQSSELIAFPDVVSGTFNGTVSTQFQAAEVLFRRALVRNCYYQADILAGYRYQQLNDDLLLSESIISSGGDTDLNDHFQTLNQFNGGQIGVATEMHGYRWTLETRLKLAFGDTHSRVRIEGNTNTTDATILSTGGLLTRSTNAGLHVSDRFSMVPELGINAAYLLTPRLRATVGYSLIYWSNVARPGDQIDTTTTALNAPDNVVHPQFVLRTTDYWVQGINLGLDYRF